MAREYRRISGDLNRRTGREREKEMRKVFYWDNNRLQRENSGTDQMGQKMRMIQEIIVDYWS